MTMNKGVSLLLLGLGYAAVWVGLYGCNDKPTDPRPVEPKNYAAYFYEGSRADSNWYFEYIPETNELDSFFLPCSGHPVISADGAKLYAQNKTRSDVVVFDLRGRRITGNLPYSVVIAASPDGRYMLVGEYQRGVSVVRTRDYTEVYSDTSIGAGVFALDSRKVYGETTDYGAYAVSLSDGSVWKKQFAEGSVHWAVPSPDEKQLYLYLGVGGNAQHMFAVYDFGADSIIFRDYMFPGGGVIQTDRDGNFVFYTNPPSMTWGGGDPWVRVYDVKNNLKADSISTVGMFPDPYQHGIGIVYLAVTPDNQWLVMLPREWPYVVSVDLESMGIAKYRYIEGILTMLGLACQTGR